MTTKRFTIELTKTIVVEVDSESFPNACYKIQQELKQGHYAKELVTAESKFELMDIGDVN